MLIHPVLYKIFKNKDENACGNSPEEIYYLKKYEFLIEAGVLKNYPVSFITKPDPNEIKLKLANLRQLVFEVTDACNLKCYYCGYGELYDNYDKRTTGRMPFKMAKQVIDYMLELWQSSYNLSYNNVVDISFYGGEPLLNFKFIKQIISYIESLQLKNMSFTYRMTTNATLLNMAMDYLVEHDFNLLISLDGDEYGDSYRMTKNGKSSFNKVCHNLDLLRQRHPDYFEKKVNFNAVLHDRNSYESIYSFIYEKYGKRPKVSELSMNGIKDKYKDRLKRMFKFSYMEQLLFIKNHKDIEHDNLEDIHLRSILHGYTGNTYKTINELLKSRDDVVHMPSGTCMAFYKKVFVTVNGKILPCEKIGQQYQTGFVHENKVDIDFYRIAAYYDSMYKPLLKTCLSCYHQSCCSQCVFLIYDSKEEGRICPSFMNHKNMEVFFINGINFLEINPSKYERQISKDTINT